MGRRFFRPVFRSFTKKICRTLARAGHTVRHLNEIPGISSPDITLDGIPAELKCLKNKNNIEREAHKAIKRQGARLIIFQFEKEEVGIYGKLAYLSHEGYHGKFYFKGREDKLYNF